MAMYLRKAWRSRGTLVAVVFAALLIAPAGAGAAVETFDDAAVFDSEFPSTQIEDFEEGLAPDGLTAVCPAPANVFSDNNCFPGGALTPGFSFRDDPLNDEDGGSSNGLAVLGTGFNGGAAASKQLVSNFLVDASVVEFNPAVTTVGFELVAHYTGADCELTLDYGEGLTQTLTAPCTPAGAFLGLRADDPIRAVRIEAPGTRAEGVDDLRFGSGPSRAECEAVTDELLAAQGAFDSTRSARREAARSLKQAKRKLRKARKSDAGKKKVRRAKRRVKKARRKLAVAKRRSAVAAANLAAARAAAAATCPAPV
jgi:hypothetical protein